MAVRLRSTGVRFDQIELVSEGTMREIGKLAVEDIVTRTESGKDHQGQPFQPYSEAYAERKAKYRGGLIGAAVGTGVVNLRGIGPGLRMLDAIGITGASARRVVIGFRTADKAELAYYHVESGAGRSRVIRDFFGLTDRFLTDAVTRIKARWKWR